MTGLFSSKNDVFSSNTCQFYKKQIKKKNLFLFELEICGSSSACRKKTRCRRMTPGPPF